MYSGESKLSFDFVYFNFDRGPPLTLKNSGIHVKQLYSVVFEVLSSITAFILEDWNGFKAAISLVATF